jgi:transcriptional regulator with XRE-family HTH domain
MRGVVGRNIEQAREARNLSQVELADKLKVRQPTVWKWENQAGIPELPTLFRIANVLEVTLDDLVIGVDETYDARRRTHADREKNRAATAAGQRLKSRRSSTAEERAGDPSVVVEARLLEEERRAHDQVRAELRAVAGTLIRLAGGQTPSTDRSTRTRPTGTGAGRRGHRA